MYYILFWALSAVLVTQVVVAVIAVVKAYRDEMRLFIFKSAFHNGRGTQNGSYL